MPMPSSTAASLLFALPALALSLALDARPAGHSRTLPPTGSAGTASENARSHQDHAAKRGALAQDGGAADGNSRSPWVAVGVAAAVSATVITALVAYALYLRRRTRLEAAQNELHNRDEVEFMRDIRSAKTSPAQDTMAQARFQEPRAPPRVARVVRMQRFGGSKGAAKGVGIARPYETVV